MFIGARGETPSINFNKITYSTSYKNIDMTNYKKKAMEWLIFITNNNYLIAIQLISKT